MADVVDELEQTAARVERLVETMRARERELLHLLDEKSSLADHARRLDEDNQRLHQRVADLEAEISVRIEREATLRDKLRGIVVRLDRIETDVADLENSVGG